MNFQIIGPIRGSETFVRGSGIRELKRLKRAYGDAYWRKRKGNATIRLDNGIVLEAEIHWYEASGIGKREFKIKRILD